jgi:hypothetical protein
MSTQYFPGPTIFDYALIGSAERGLPMRVDLYDGRIWLSVDSGVFTATACAKPGQIEALRDAIDAALDAQVRAKAQVTHEYPPIPSRDYDYSATLPDYDGGDPIGRGPTAEAAIDDLVEQVREA